MWFMVYQVGYLSSDQPATSSLLVERHPLLIMREWVDPRNEGDYVLLSWQELSPVEVEMVRAHGGPDRFTF